MASVSESMGKSKTTTGRTASKEVRRRQLIEATIESIAKHGISRTTMTTVTGFAGLSLGIVNFHFQNKENLYEETLRFLAEEHRARWLAAYENAGLAPQDKLLAIVDAHFTKQVSNRKKLAVWFAFYGEAQYRASYRKLMAGIDDERWEISSKLCAEIIQDGGYSGVDAREVSDTLEGLYDGFCLNILLYPGEFSRDVAVNRIRDFLARTFPDHIAPAPGPACSG